MGLFDGVKNVFSTGADTTDAEIEVEKELDRASVPLVQASEEPVDDLASSDEAEPPDVEQHDKGLNLTPVDLGGRPGGDGTKADDEEESTLISPEGETTDGMIRLGGAQLEDAVDEGPDLDEMGDV